MIMILLLLFLKTFIHFSNAFDHFSWEIPSCEKKYCLTKKTILQKMLFLSIPNKIKFQEIYRSYLNIKIQRGGITPHTNLDSFHGQGISGIFASNIPQGATTIFSNFFGFLFPVRWFNLKKAKKEYWAEKYSYYLMQANFVNWSENIFLELEYFLYNREILNFYKNKLLKILEIEKSRFDLQALSMEKILELTIFIQKVENEILLNEQNYKTLLNTLLENLSIYQDRDAKLEDFGIIVSKIQPYKNFKKSYPGLENIERAKELSLDLKSSVHLLKASYFRLKSHRWEFISPQTNPESSLGLTLSGTLKTQKSYIRTIKLNMDFSKIKITQAVYSLYFSNNYFIDNLLYMDGNRKFLINQFRLVENDFLESENLNIPVCIKINKEMMETDLYFSFLYHSYLINESNLKRLYLNGEHYKTFKNFILTNK